MINGQTMFIVRLHSPAKKGAITIALDIYKYLSAPIVTVIRGKVLEMQFMAYKDSDGVILTIAVLD